MQDDEDENSRCDWIFGCKCHPAWHSIASTPIDGIRIAALFVQADGQGKERVLASVPAVENGMLRKEAVQLYEWETWQQPQFQERLKQSYYIVKKAFTAIE